MIPGPVLCVGPVAVDLVVEGFAPADLDKLRTWTGPATVQTLAAGSIGYVALSLAALSLRTRLESCVGTDALGTELIERFAEAGVPTDGLRVLPGETGLAIYLRILGDSKRPMVFRAAEFEPWPATIDLDHGDEPAMLVVSGALHFPEYSAANLGPLLRACRERGIPVVLDPQFAPEHRAEPWEREFAEILSLTDLLCCDEQEGAQLFGTPDADEIIARGHAAGCRVVVVKREHLGAVLDDGVRRVYQPAVSLGSGIGSTIGSGDAFLAGLSTKLLAGAALDELARYATAVAAVAIMNPLGIRGITAAAVDAMLASVPAAQRLRIPHRARQPHSTTKGNA